MNTYYVNRNAQTNGDHEVHVSGCTFMPHELNRVPLGYHASCQSAVREAKNHYRQTNGCYYCCNPCHTQ